MKISAKQKHRSPKFDRSKIVKTPVLRPHSEIVPCKQTIISNLYDLGQKQRIVINPEYFETKIEELKQRQLSMQALFISRIKNINKKILLRDADSHLLSTQIDSLRKTLSNKKKNLQILKTIFKTNSVSSIPTSSFKKSQNKNLPRSRLTSVKASQQSLNSKHKSKSKSKKIRLIHSVSNLKKDKLLSSKSLF